MNTKEIFKMYTKELFELLKGKVVSSVTRNGEADQGIVITFEDNSYLRIGYSSYEGRTTFSQDLKEDKDVVDLNN